MKEGDACVPLVEALDGKGEPAGEGMALYTFRDRKGAILGCTMQFAGGFTEQEQAELLQTLYLSYLANGIDRLYFYDFHSDGESPAERENNFGIGLSLSRQVLAQQNGTVQAENVLTGGARFILRWYKGTI